MVNRRTTHQPYTLGLDIGMASVGAALLGEEHILGLFVRTFNKAEDRGGETFGQAWRKVRGARQRLRARHRRLLAVRALLEANGLALAAGSDPWQARASGLSERLPPEAWAQALFHLAKHRGYRPRKEAAGDAEGGAIRQAVRATSRRLVEEGWETAGQMLALAPGKTVGQPHRRNKSGAYVCTLTRPQILDEAALLFERQRTLGNPCAGRDLEAAFVALLEAQAQAPGAVESMVGDCTFEEGERRAPREDPLAERFRWLSRLGTMKVGAPGRWRRLSQGEVAAAADLPFQYATVSWKRLRAVLGIAATEGFRDVEAASSGRKPASSPAPGASPEDGQVFQASGFHALRKAYREAGLTAAWETDSRNAPLLGTLIAAAALFKDPDDARGWLRAQGVPEAVATATMGVSSRGFITLSHKALAKIVPHMQAGLRYDEAVSAASLAPRRHARQPTATGRLPRACADGIVNPRVRRAVRQACLVINAIVDRHGPPAAVHIELARDLSRPLDERRAIQRSQEAYRAQRALLAAKFIHRFARPPRGDELERYALFLEQGGVCPYCQQPLDESRIVEGGYAEIDHALPVSRSHEPGRRNQVLVHTRENREKGSQTPYEWLGGAAGSARWQAFEAWVLGNPGYAGARAKRDRLLCRDLSSEVSGRFLDRHLNDTRHICVEVKDIIERFMAAPDGQPIRCVAVSGQATARLRQGWGLVKVRAESTLHHALDAAVVAAASRSLVQRLAEANAAAEMGDPSDFRARMPMPWPGTAGRFRKELLARLGPDPAKDLALIEGYPKDMAAQAAPIQVSRPPRRNAAGEAHGATLLSPKNATRATVIKRVPLGKVNLKMLGKMLGHDDERNRPLVEAIRTRLQASGNNPAKAFATPLLRPSRTQASPDNAPIVRAIKVRVPLRNRMEIRAGTGIVTRGDMLRADIHTDGKHFFAVPVYVSDLAAGAPPTLAARAGKPAEQWTDMANPPGKYRLLFNLRADDWVRAVLPNGTIVEGYYSTLDVASCTLAIWPQASARTKGDKPQRVSFMHLAALEKFCVDALGRLWVA